jgi:hypothetical protein
VISGGELAKGDDPSEIGQADAFALGKAATATAIAALLRPRVVASRPALPDQRLDQSPPSPAARRCTACGSAARAVRHCTLAGVAGSHLVSGGPLSLFETARAHKVVERAARSAPLPSNRSLSQTITM